MNSEPRSFLGSEFLVAQRFKSDVCFMAWLGMVFAKGGSSCRLSTPIQSLC